MALTEIPPPRLDVASPHRLVLPFDAPQPPGFEVLAGFHPAVRTWFERTFPLGPTPPQEQAWPSIAAGHDTLVAAPTGSGKTLSAFLVAIDDLYQRHDAGSPHARHRPGCVRVAAQGTGRRHQRESEPPARADRGRRPRARAQPPFLRVGVRTGDTTSSQRSSMLRKPPALHRHHARVALSPGHRREEPRRAAHRAHRHRRRNPRRGPRQARIAPGAHPRTARTRLAATARRGSGCRPPSARSKPSPGCWSAPARSDAARPPRLRDRRPRPPPRARPRHSSFPTASSRRVASGRAGGRDARPASPSMIEQHRTTLVFVNTRRMAERVAHQLGDRLGDDHGRRPPRVSCPRNGASGSRRGFGPASSRPSWRPRRSSSASTSGRSSWSARSGRRAASLRSCSASAVPGHTRVRHAQGSAVPAPRATSWSSARPCCAAVRAGRLDADPSADRSARHPGPADRGRDARPDAGTSTSCSP